MTQSRREFLKLTALLAGGVMTQPLHALSIHDDWNKSRGNPQNVLILGAGVSGMAAAIELINLGHTVKIIEGQMRAGGRIQTLRSAFADDLYVDMGAARIPENHDWTMKYIREYDLDLHPFNPSEGDFIHMMKGKKIPYSAQTSAGLEEYPVNLTSAEMDMGWPGISSAPFQEVLNNLGDPTSLDWPTQDIAPNDAYSFKEYLERKGYSREIADLLMIGWETDEGMNMSVLELIRELTLSFGAPRNKIVGGNDLLPAKMAESLGNHIQYGTKVTDLRQGENEVSVSVARGGISSTMTADRVICTFPLPVLRKMDVVKTLTSGKQDAINELTYWDLSRTAIQVSDRYWKKEGFNGFAATDQPMEIWDPNYESTSTRGLIAAYVKHDDSQLFNSLSDQERLDFSSNHINQVFPGLMDHFEGGHTKCWKEDPWALGAHSIGSRNQMTDLLPHLIKPEGRIHFAGEHASAYHGWIQGAIESGNRTAKEINSY
jgi:monoamine oxidase